jgi:hypothetical protein
MEAAKYQVEGQTHDLLHSSQEHLTITNTKEVGGQHFFLCFISSNKSSIMLSLCYLENVDHYFLCCNINLLQRSMFFNNHGFSFKVCL